LQLQEFPPTKTFCGDVRRAREDQDRCDNCGFTVRGGKVRLAVSATQRS
jgi:hypothetical protein